VRKITLKYLFIVFGFLSLAAGVIGLFFPVLPTTPFLLLASYFFVRSSERLHNWLINHKVLGTYIVNYSKHRAMKRSTKRTAVATLWLSMCLSMFLVKNIYVTILLVITGAFITKHILSLRDMESVEGSD